MKIYLIASKLSMRCNTLMNVRKFLQAIYGGLLAGSDGNIPEEATLILLQFYVRMPRERKKHGHHYVQVSLTALMNDLKNL